MAAGIASRRPDARVGVFAALLREAPLGVEPRLLWIREVDRDQRGSMDPPPAAGRGVRVPPARPPDPMDARSLDRQEADAARGVGDRDVVDHDAGALGIGRVVWVALVIHEQEPIGVLSLVRVRALRRRQLAEDLRAPEVRDVDDARRDAGVAHVPHVHDIPVAHDLHPVALPVEVGVTDELKATCVQDARQVAHRPSVVGRFDSRPGCANDFRHGARGDAPAGPIHDRGRGEGRAGPPIDRVPRSQPAAGSRPPS